MKTASLLLIITSCCALAQQSEEVRTEVRGFRSDFFQGTSGQKSALSVRLNFTSLNGRVISPGSQQPATLTAKDESGKSYKSQPAEIIRNNDAPDSASGSFSFTPRPKAGKLEIDSKVKIELAESVYTHTPRRVHMLEPSLWFSRGVPLQAIPAKSNGEKKNREREMLHHAEITLEYPPIITLVSVRRLWDSEGEGTDNAYRQEVQIHPQKDGEHGQKRCTIHLWDVREQEMLEVTTATNLHTAEVPVKFTLSLEGASAPTEETENDAPAQQ